MRLFEFLEKKKKRRNAFFKSEEYKYYLSNHLRLKEFPIFPYLGKNNRNECDIMRANIVLQGLENKETIEIEVENINTHFEAGKKPTHEKYILTLRERTIDSPYYFDGNIKIFIPFFSRALNTVYSRDPEKLLKSPFLELRDSFSGSLVDPFDTYGSELYNSSFTRLIKIGSNGNEYGYFHYDTNTIYIINDQGRLDIQIPLFDKYLKFPNYNHMLERIAPVFKEYVNNNRAGFIQALYDNNFISRKMLGLIKRKCKR